MKQKTSVFYILVFKTDLYDKEKGKANRLDYGRFIKVMWQASNSEQRSLPCRQNHSGGKVAYLHLRPL